jgi:hypothetical protein
MGKSGKGLAILAFILALGGLGFGGFSFFYFSNLIPASTTTSGKVVQDIWYAEYLTHQTPSEHPTYTTLTNMQLVITVNQGESVYISFNAKYTIDNSGVYEYIESFIYQNGTMIPAPYAYVGEVNSGSQDSLRMVSLQYSISGLAVGDYEFSIRATTGNNAFNRIDDTILFIQTYL